MSHPPTNRLLEVAELVTADVLLAHPEMRRTAWLITPDGYNPQKVGTP